ncbi:ORF6N domain-containing protein [Aequorivita capsosiphonis]|uniref:ORF6N domain-containing protein n=1 Tax=Aequorivita capsosiphonis TaxID=487317 RepID=UPI00042593C2|nr:ORF6N domain-containing protein [Aequorivita capsosiphonis]
MLDFDLAEIYGVETRVLKQAVRRNMERFHNDFMFELTENEFENLRSQLVMSNQHGGTRYKPFAFTEQGVAMLSSVLRSKTAILVNISIIRAFVMMRQFALSHKELGEKLSKLEEKYDQQFNNVNDVLRYLMQKDRKEKEQIERKRIGFK